VVGRHDVACNEEVTVPDLGLDGDESQWWFNLRTQKVEQGLGDGNADRMGPYLTREEAEAALDRARERNEAWEAQDDQ